MVSAEVIGFAFLMSLHVFFGLYRGIRWIPVDKSSG